MENKYTNRKFQLLSIFFVLFIIFFSYSFLLTSPRNFVIGEAIPFWEYADQAVKSIFLKYGQIGLWDTNNGIGYPLHAYFGTQFYPLTIFGYLIADPLLSMRYVILIHLLLGGVSCFYLLKVLKCNNKSALAGSCIYILSAYTSETVFNGFYAEITNLVWMPLTLAFLWQGLYSRKIIYSISSGIAFAMQVFQWDCIVCF